MDQPLQVQVDTEENIENLLTAAVENGHIDIVKGIEENNGQVIDKIGVVPLMIEAARGGHIEMMKLLKTWSEIFRWYYDMAAQVAVSNGQIVAARLAKTWADEAPGMSHFRFDPSEAKEGTEGHELLTIWEKQRWALPSTEPPGRYRGRGKYAALNQEDADHCRAWQIG